MLHHRAARPEAPRAATPLVIAADLPPVSIIIPTRNRLDLLLTCLDGVAATRYPDIALIVVDNDRDDPATLAYLAAQAPASVRVLRQPGPLTYSTMNTQPVVQSPRNQRRQETRRAGK